MPSRKIVVGLGNPGADYSATRHNLGFMVVDALTGKFGTSMNFEKHRLYSLGQIKIDDVPAMLAKPQTFMNRSGAAVSELCGIFEIALSDLLVIVDDFNLPFGKLRLRSKGSDGGHNGLASIIDELGTSDFARLRVGIGKEFIDDTVDFVLSPFDKLERVDLKVILDQCVQACTSFVVEGINKAMNRYN